tara:strand:+ start:703 stop:1041 length:339 start_codon:yes stop_codon:yes gene_type:complete
MKKFLLLMSLSILLQSCFSYTALDYKRYAIQRTQEVKVQTNNQESYKGRFVSVNENEISIISKTNGQQLKIPHANVANVHTRALSVPKTVAFITLTPIVLLLLLIGSYDPNE